MGRPISVKALENMDFGFLPDDRVTLKITTIYGPSKVKAKVKNYTVTQETDQCVTLDNGQYKETINKRDIALGVVKTEIIKWERDDEMGLKFTREELLDAARQVGGKHFGYLKEICVLLGDKATDIKQVSYAVSKWNIFEELAKEEVKEKMDDDYGVVEAEDKPTPRPNDAVAAMVYGVKALEDAKEAITPIKGIELEPAPIPVEEAKPEVIRPWTEDTAKAMMEELKGQCFFGMDLGVTEDKPQKRLRIEKVSANVCDYELGKVSGMVFINPKGIKEDIPIAFEDIDEFIAELQELREEYISKMEGDV